MNNVILAINAGSSSIKFSLFHFETLNRILHGEIKDIFKSVTFSVFNDKDESLSKIKKLDVSGYEPALKFFFHWFDNYLGQSIVKAVGHRMVHGGPEFFNPVRIDNEVIKKLTSLISLAPLHASHNIEAIKIIAKLYPDMIQVACFDTAFHRTQNRLATLFAIPRKLTEEGMIRYGFHGLSYEYIASVLPNTIDITQNKKIIVAHLGNGASMCALYELKSIATTMGFSPLDGLMMGTRCGTIDPGLILYFLRKKMSLEQITHLLYNESGLLGVSGISSDIRDLLSSNKSEALEAIDLFCYRAAREIGALAIILKGYDAIVFTGGIGENSPCIRKKICEWLDWMGVQVDDLKNNRNDTIISHTQSKAIVAVIPTNEDYIIAKHTLFLIKENE